MYQLFEVIQFLKLLSRIVRGQFSLGQTLQVIALGQKDTSPSSLRPRRMAILQSGAVLPGSAALTEYSLGHRAHTRTDCIHRVAEAFF